MVTVVHPEHGSYRFHIHGLRSRGTDGLTLTAFGNGATSLQQCEIVFATAAGTNSDVVRMEQADIPADLGVFLAAKHHAEPETGVLVVPGGEWGLTGAGREICYRTIWSDDGEAGE